MTIRSQAIQAIDRKLGGIERVATDHEVLVSVTFAGAKTNRRIVAQYGAHCAALLVLDVLGGIGSDVERGVHDVAVTQDPQASTTRHLATAVGFGHSVCVAGGVDVQLAKGQRRVAVQAAQDDHAVFFTGHQAGVGQQPLQCLLQGELAAQGRGTASG
ncbi:hypothetical protein D3C77_240920 [compost metagenome]